MNTRNTRQKEIIFQTLNEMHTHPTILELCEAVRYKDSSIGQATVYRNVSKLVEEGKVRRVLTNDGVDHYDADCSQHVHFVCRKCHRLFDLYDISTSSLAKQMKGYHEFDVEKIHILFEGTCDHCKQSL